jgi:AcrR family transcriptional regulator
VLAGVTVRAVAEAARVSPGLVLFHFGQKEELVSELLDHLIEDAAPLRISAWPFEDRAVLLHQLAPLLA